MGSCCWRKTKNLRPKCRRVAVSGGRHHRVSGDMRVITRRHVSPCPPNEPCRSSMTGPSTTQSREGSKAGTKLLFPFTVPPIVLSTMKPIILYTPDFITWSASRACSRLWTCISSMTQGYQERFGELASFWPWPVIIFTKLLWLILHRSMTDEVNPVCELVSKHAHGGLCLCRVRLMFA